MRLALKGELHQQLHERPDVMGALTELPADGGRPAWEERVCRWHEGQEFLAEHAIWNREVAEHAMNGMQGLAQTPGPAPLSFLHVLGRAGMEVLDEPIGHG